MMATYGNALANPGGGSVGSNNNNNDPYFQNDFYPLQRASSEILSALRTDESAPDADLYRRLISSSGVGAHRYHRVEGGVCFVAHVNLATPATHRRRRRPITLHQVNKINNNARR